MRKVRSGKREFKASAAGDCLRGPQWFSRKRCQRFAGLAVVAAFFYLALDLVPWQTLVARPPLVLPNDIDLSKSALSLSFTSLPPLDNPRLARLGQRLFFDPGFSANGRISCASCHVPERAFTDGKSVATGIGTTARNTPTLANVFADTWFFWDGRATSLEAQALGPVEAPGEHGFSRTQVARRLRDFYKADYEAAFGRFPTGLGDELPRGRPQNAAFSVPLTQANYALATGPSLLTLAKILLRAQEENLTPPRYLAAQMARDEDVDQKAAAQFAALPPRQQQDVNQVYANFGRALAAYERGLTALDSPFDHFAQGLRRGLAPHAALVPGFGERELEGLRLFAGPAHCMSCHNGPNFTDQEFHNVGLPSPPRVVVGPFGIDMGRAKGLLLAAADPFNCRGPYLRADPYVQNAESCLELPYLDANNPETVGAFKTPTLRNVAVTAPYEHDGRFKNLDAVLRFYDEANTTPAVGHREETIKPLHLSAEEREALKAFLESLTSPITDRLTGVVYPVTQKKQTP